MPQRILIESTGLMSPRLTGIGRYGLELTRALSEHPGLELQLCAPRTRRGGWRHLAGRLPGLPRRPYLTGSLLGRAGDLLHALDTRLPRSCSVPVVATIFDLLAALPLSAELGLSSDRFRRRKLDAYRRIAARASAIVTLAHAVRDDVLRVLRPSCPVHVIPPGVELAPAPSTREEDLSLLAKHGIAPPYLLSVGALCPRKNLEEAVETLLALRPAHPELRLVLVGERAYGWEGSAGERLAREAGDRVRLAGYLDERTLRAAYRQTELVLHLSHYEGYGLTILEALASGAPVVAHATGGIPEAAGGAALLVPPGTPGAAARAAATALAGGPEATSRRRLGLAHARALPWSLAAERMVQVYHEVLACRGTRG